jgi:hypothetical protein
MHKRSQHRDSKRRVPCKECGTWILDLKKGHRCFAWYDVRILDAMNRPQRVWAISAPLAASQMADDLEAAGKHLGAPEVVALVRKRGDRVTYRVLLTSVDLTRYVATQDPVPVR